MNNGTSADSAAVFGVFLACFAVVSILYVWTALALDRVFAKLGESGVAAWIPIVNLMTLLRLGGMSAVFVVFLLFPPLSVVGAVMLLTAVHRINLRFDRGASLTVLAFFSLPIWASVIGFGAAVPIGGVARFTGGRSPARATDDAAWIPASAALAAVPAAPPLGATTAPAPAVPRPPVITAEVAQPESAGNPWAPPVVKASAPPVPPVAVPAIPPSPTARPTRVPLLPAVELVDEVPDLDKTVVSPRVKKQGWSITAEGGATVKLSKSTALLGRNPASRDDFPETQLVAFPDPSKTVSKTHAHLALVDNAWSITDLASTNGTYLLSANDEESEIATGIPTPVTERFRLGDLTLRISMES